MTKVRGDCKASTQHNIKLIVISILILFLLIVTAGCGGPNKSVPKLPSDITSFKAIDINNVWVWQCKEFSPSGLKLFKTSNGGRSWIKVTIPASLFPKTNGKEELLPKFYFPDAKTVYIMEIASGKLITLKTTDGGNHWVKYVSAVGRYAQFVSTVCFVSYSKGYITALSEGGVGQQIKYLYYTSDGGKVWDELKISDNVSDDSPSGLPVAEGPIAMNFIDSNNGMILTSDISSSKITMYITKDGGILWKKKPLPTPDQCKKCCVTFISKPVFSDNQGTFVSVFYRNNNGKENIQPVIYRTTDYGNAWMPFVVKNFGSASASIKGLPIFFSNPMHGYTISRGDLYITKDGGNVWDKIHSDTLSNAMKNYPIMIKLQFTNSMNGWVLLKSKDYKNTAILKTTDGGITWNVINK